MHPSQQTQRTTTAAQTDPHNLLVRHTRPQVVILTGGILETVLTLLHVLASVPTQTLHREIDQALATVARVVAGTLPPHGTTKTGVLDVLDLLARNLRRVVGDHGARCWVVGPGRDGLGVFVDLGASFGESLEISLADAIILSISTRVINDCPQEGSD